jgi:alkylation response protein AidB-like acyl-CoA dehydrogenase
MMADDVRTQAESELMAAARRLAPQIAAAADEIERQGRLPQPIVDALLDAGLFRMLVPQSLGGLEVHLTSFVAAIEIIAQADASTAWCLAQGAGGGQIAAGLDRRVAAAIFGDGRTIVAWGPGAGTAVAVEGGYRINGSWPFASGCRHANWMGGTARIISADGSPRLGPDGSPEVRRMLFPSAAVTIVDVWHVSGLKGTGSDTYSVEELFVDRAYTLPAALSGLPIPDIRYDVGKLYSFPLVYIYAVGFASVALGIARGALDAFVDLAGAKTPRSASGLLRDDAVIQSEVARSEAAVRAARAYLRQAIEEAWDAAQPDSLISIERRAQLRLAATHAIHAAAQAVDVIYQCAGATAIFTANPFERRFRDIHTVTQQAQASGAHFKTAGQYFLGAEPGSAAL